MAVLLVQQHYECDILYWYTSKYRFKWSTLLDGVVKKQGPCRILRMIRKNVDERTGLRFSVTPQKCIMLSRRRRRLHEIAKQVQWYRYIVSRVKKCLFMCASRKKILRMQKKNSFVVELCRRKLVVLVMCVSLDTHDKVENWKHFWYATIAINGGK